MSPNQFSPALLKLVCYGWILSYFFFHCHRTLRNFVNLAEVLFLFFFPLPCRLLLTYGLNTQLETASKNVVKEGTGWCLSCVFFHSVFLHCVQTMKFDQLARPLSSTPNLRKVATVWCAPCENVSLQCLECSKGVQNCILFNRWLCRQKFQWPLASHWQFLAPVFHAWNTRLTLHTARLQGQW